MGKREEGVEASGKTIDEAIDAALEDMGLLRSQVKIEIVDAGSPGVLGLGKSDSKVRLTPLSSGDDQGANDLPQDIVSVSDDDKTEVATKDSNSFEPEVMDINSGEVGSALDCLCDLLDMMDISAEVTAREPETVGEGVGRVSAVLDVSGDDLGVLIGRRGSTLASLQYVVNLMISRKGDTRFVISVDVGSYKRRREDGLSELAEGTAASVAQNGEEIALDPMPAADRRIVHLTLADDDRISTSSVGSGYSRRVLISPNSDS